MRLNFAKKACWDLDGYYIESVDSFSQNILSGFLIILNSNLQTWYNILIYLGHL